MLRKIEIAVLLLSALACVASVSGAQRKSLKLVPDDSPTGIGALKALNDNVRVRWVQLPDAEPPECDIYYAAAPAAGNLSSYRKLSLPSSVVEELSNGIYMRVKSFSAGLPGPGVWYVIAARDTVNEAGDRDTLYSDYMKLMVASDKPPVLVQPKGDLGKFVAELNERTPVFSWQSVAGVPFYHIVVSDKPFIDSDGSLNADGVNVIWQAITPGTGIAYGAPDPSNMFTAKPPPLSPDSVYSWMVLGNYGNHPAFTSWSVLPRVEDVMFGKFKVKGGAVSSVVAREPKNNKKYSYPAQVEFSWNINPNASSYLVNLLKTGRADNFDMGSLGDFKMGMLVWETTVAGDVSKATLDAKNTLTNGDYMWCVYALDSQGKALAADRSNSLTFKYENRPEGTVTIETREKIGIRNLPVGFVELKSEVIEGPAMEPLLFYTKGDGTYNGNFAVGTYRITAVKDGYFSYTATVSVRAGSNPTIEVPLSRPEAFIFGRAMLASAADTTVLSGARVTAVSEWGDTVFGETGGDGSFALACRAAEWAVTVTRPGLRASLSKRVALMADQNEDLGIFYLSRNAFALSGVVRNASGGPIAGARVRVLRDGVLVDELASTLDGGGYVFYLGAGTYTVTAEKPGFAIFSGSVAVTGAIARDIILRDGVFVSGAVMGKSRVMDANGNYGNYVYAPVASARVAFAKVGGTDTFTVTGDAVFGKFSLSLPKAEYYVTASAAGFAAGSGHTINTDNMWAGLTEPYIDTLCALAMIRGNIRDRGGSNRFDAADVDVVVYDNGGRIVASARSAGAAYEVRNIPDGEFTVKAGAVTGAGGYSALDSYSITVRDGIISSPAGPFDFRMESGGNSVGFEVVDYVGGGRVTVLSPFNRTLDINGGQTDVLSGVGGGDYIAEAIPDSLNWNFLALSYHKFAVSGIVTEPLHFAVVNIMPNDTSVIPDDNGSIKIKRPTMAVGAPTPTSMMLYYRSEGSARFDSVRVVSSEVTIGNGNNSVRDSCRLYYYFRVSVGDDVYGSSKQLYSVSVLPKPMVISHVSVEPGVMAGDSLVLPSSYTATFTFRAFRSDRFSPVSVNGSVGTVSWSFVTPNNPKSKIVDRSGAVTKIETAAGQEAFTLRAVFKPSGGASGYTLKSGKQSDTVDIPVRVTGKKLKSIAILRKGDGGGAISNTGTADFRVEAFDSDSKAVNVLPDTIYVFPSGAQKSFSDGLFTPNPVFCGVAKIYAKAGGLRAGYFDPVEKDSGQRVNYELKGASRGNTANTMLGMRVVFPDSALPAGASARLKISAIKPDNLVSKVSDDYKMADSVIFKLSYSDVNAIDSSVVLAFDVPGHLREAAKDGGYEFTVARWFPDSSLRWIPVVSGGRSNIKDNVAYVTLSRAAAGQSKARRAVKKTAAQVPREAALTDSALYALMVKTSRTSLDLSVSPHPFSPYIRPTIEYGMDAPPGTCIKVNVMAPDMMVKSLKVRIYNTTGKLVWGIERQLAPTGENRFWWNGKTSGGGRGAVSEDVWSKDYYNDKAGGTEGYYKGNGDRPMCRNGRYYVMAIMTDMEGKQVRKARSLVLMK